jgi:ACR3 family arsenite transporter
MFSLREPHQAIAALPDTPERQTPTTAGAPITFFEKYLSLWVLLCMICGALIGFYAPAVADGLATAEFAHINAIVAVLLWLMLVPMLVQIDFASILAVRRAPGAVALTCFLSYAVKPFTMYALAMLFLKVLYTAVIPDPALRDSYVAGLILLAGAPCTAMVFVWSALVGGDAAYTLVQVAANDLLMLALFVPIVGGLIGAANIAMPWATVVTAVLLFIVAPLLLASAVRVAVIRARGEAFLRERVVEPFKPVTIVALLATLVLIFIFQGRVIGERPLHIVLLAVPIVVQCAGVFALCVALGWWLKIPFERLAPACLIGTSNFFELAVAVAVSVYGLQSGAALATVVGVLVEVPVMLLLVHACKLLKPTLDKRCERSG